MRNPNQLIIGVTGNRRHGKDTFVDAAAQHLASRFDVIVWKHGFAKPIRNFMSVIGLSEDEAFGRGKEQPNDVLCGNSPRYAMQTLGTEWGRDTIGQQLWVNVWRRTLPDNADVVLVEDCRFHNEALAIRDLGGIIVKVIRPELAAMETTSADAHASEQEMRGINPDTIIYNDELDQFRRDAAKAAEEILLAHNPNVWRSLV